MNHHQPAMTDSASPLFTKEGRPYSPATIATQILAVAGAKPRYLVAIAGPPASGKSTLAEQLMVAINAEAGEAISAVVPMDGFHLDNAVLDQRGWRERKGAPQTFDSDGFVRLIKHLATHTDDTPVPLFDRDQDAVIAEAGMISAQQRILLVEGNYLLLTQAPWSSLHSMYDAMIFLNPGIEILKQRLTERWLQQGYDEHGAGQRASSNDIPNAEYVLTHSLRETSVLTLITTA